MTNAERDTLKKKLNNPNICSPRVKINFNGSDVKFDFICEDTDDHPCEICKFFKAWPAPDGTYICKFKSFVGNPPYPPPYCTNREACLDVWERLRSKFKQVADLDLSGMGKSEG